MALLNVIDVPAVCPKCGSAYDSGFEIDEGKKLRYYLRIGDAIPCDGRASLPVGEWTTEGLGRCLACGAWITADVHVDGATVRGIDGIALPNPYHPRAETPLLGMEPNQQPVSFWRTFPGFLLIVGLIGFAIGFALPIFTFFWR